MAANMQSDLPACRLTALPGSRVASKQVGWQTGVLADVKTIAVISQKGGNGKTTLAIHLAALAAETQKVMVMDLDPQGSALEWASRRGDRPPDITAAHPASLAKEIERGREDGYILTVIDTAPHADHVALQAARAADLVVIPCRPATFDIAAISATLDLCKLANKQAVVVINCAPIRSRVVQEAVAAIEEKGGEVCPIVIRQRVAYQHCLIDGRTAGEFEPGGPAATEIAELLANLQTWKQADVHSTAFDTPTSTSRARADARSIEAAAAGAAEGEGE
jgi:chromosome partitioning protein